MTELEKLAVMLAIEAPARQAGHVVSASVSWETIHRLRGELDHRGFDWRKARKEYERLRAERKAKYNAERKNQVALRPGLTQENST